MVGYGRINLSHGQNNVPPQRPSSYSRKQMTCRLCGRVLLSTQALIAHIEAHLIQDEMATRSRQNQKYPHKPPPNLLNIPRPHSCNLLVCNPNFRPAFPMPPPPPFFPGPVVQRPMAMRPVNNISLTLGNGSGPAQIIKIISHPPNTPPQVSPLVRNDGGKLVTQAHKSVVEAAPVDDVTKPFRRQLEQPIGKVEVVDLEEENGDKLDLTLKL